jgi:hypothetical protein
MGFAHGVAHDKSALAGLEDWQNVLLSLCFCDACRAGLDRAGHDPFALVASIRAGFAKRSAAVEEAVASVLAYRAQVAHTVAAELAAVINATEAAFVAISATVRLDEFGSFAPLPVAPQGVGGLVAQLSAPNGAGWADAQRWRENPQLCVSGMFELEGRRLNIPAALHADGREAGTNPDVLDEVYLYHVGSLPPDRISALSLHS